MANTQNNTPILKCKYKLNFDWIDPEYLDKIKKTEQGLNKDNFMAYRINPHSFKQIKAGEVVELDVAMGEELCKWMVPLHYQSVNPGSTGELVDFPEAEKGCTRVPFAEKID